MPALFISLQSRSYLESFNEIISAQVVQKEIEIFLVACDAKSNKNLVIIKTTEAE